MVVPKIVPAPRPFTPGFFVPPTLPVFLPAFVPVAGAHAGAPDATVGHLGGDLPVEAPQREEEDEAAPESVSNEAVAYRAPEHEPPPAFLLGVIVLAAFAGASIRGRRRRGGRTPELAPSLVTSRAQRRMTEISTRDRRHRLP